MIRITERSKPKLPEPKSIVIGTVATGEVTACMYGARLTWHACIKPNDTRVLCHLLQGHGPTPEDAVKQAVECEARDIQERVKVLSSIKAECFDESDDKPPVDLLTIANERLAAAETALRDIVDNSDDQSAVDTATDYFGSLKGGAA